MTTPTSSVADNSAISNATSTTFGFCDDNPIVPIDGAAEHLEYPPLQQTPFPHFDDNYMQDWNGQHPMNDDDDQLLRDGLLFSDLDGCNFDGVNNGAQSINLMFLPVPPLPALPENGGGSFEQDSDVGAGNEPPTPVRPPAQQRTNRKKRKFVPTPENFLARKAIGDALSILKKYRGVEQPCDGVEQPCDGGIVQMSIKALTNTFNNAMSTPLSQCLPPPPATIVAMSHKMRVEKGRVVRVDWVESNTIVVEAMEAKRIGHAPQQWSFVFTNGEWVCGERVLFI